MDSPYCHIPIPLSYCWPNSHYSLLPPLDVHVLGSTVAQDWKLKYIHIYMVSDYLHWYMVLLLQSVVFCGNRVFSVWWRTVWWPHLVYMWNWLRDNSWTQTDKVGLRYPKKKPQHYRLVVQSTICPIQVGHRWKWMSNAFKVLSDFGFCSKLLCKHLTLLCNALTWSNPWIQNRASDICLMTFFHSVLLASKWLRCYHNGHGMYRSRSTLQALCEERNKRYLKNDYCLLKNYIHIHKSTLIQIKVYLLQHQGDCLILYIMTLNYILWLVMIIEIVFCHMINKVTWTKFGLTLQALWFAIVLCYFGCYYNWCLLV